MFGENNSVQIQARPGRKLLSAALIFSFVTVSLSSTVKAAAGDGAKLTLKNTLKQKFSSDVQLGDFQAEVFAGATKLSWKTSFEQNVLGFKVWREEKGEKVLVTEEMVPGSLLKVTDGLLQAGSEYSFYDLTDSANALYWLEAVDVNSRSVWFGPVYPQYNYDQLAADNESEIIAEYRRAKSERRGQTEAVDFQAPVSGKESFKTAPLADDFSPVDPAIEEGLLASDPNALKVEVRADGLYRIDAPTLTANGFNVAQSAYWKLFSNGTEEPMVVNADGSIEFFGEGIDTIQTGGNIYWLMTDTTAGKRIKKVSQKYLTSARNNATRVTVERKDKLYRVTSILNGARENWFGAVVNSTAVNQTLDVRDISSEGGTTATIGVDLQGLTSASHVVNVLLNGVSIGQINYSFYDRTQWTATVALSRLVEGTNTITMQAVGGSSDVNITEAVRISYPRALKAQNNRLDFSVASGQSVKLKGFSSSQVRILDVTNPLQVSEVAPQSRQESDGTYSVTIGSTNNNRLMTALSTNAAPMAVASLAKNNPSNLKTTQNQAKFIVIAPSEYKTLLQNFINARNARGIQTLFVDIEDVYDEFNNGVKSAESVRSFLQYAKTSWSVKPDFVMFVGDATTDPRNYSGFGGYAYNRVPTFLVDTWNMETVSDEMLADFNNDGIGEIATGRLPAKDENELTAMLDKIMTVQAMSKQEINQRGVHFVSDTLIDYDFANGSRNMATYFPSTVAVNYLDAASQDPNVVRGNIVSRINSGPAIVNYFGHASVGSWANNQFFRSADAPLLNNTPNTPFMALIDCLNGDYAEANMTSLAEALIKQRNGGANSVWAASGYNGAYDQEYFTKDFYKKVFTGMPLGEAARQTKMLYTNVDLRRTYIFFGDPTQPLVTP
jgi:hypothetical protein